MPYHYVWSQEGSKVTLTVTTTATNATVTGLVTTPHILTSGNLDTAGNTYTWNDVTEGSTLKAQAYWEVAGGRAYTPMLSYVVKSTATTGLDSLTATEETAVEYYNLNGLRVDNPTTGIYLRRCGTKVVKVIL